ncbi:MAG: iron-containing alcohol dehydrogenase, partial [Betaproteobacteria bacterium]|nr:iron-containing alcohol dehydrogenase [Betaproteobacteria bacterium]
TPLDIEARTALSLGALEAGLAFSQTRTALAHALSYALTLDHDVPHGRAVAAWLPTACRLAAGCDAQIDRLLEEALDVDVDACADALREWLQSLGISADPASYGVMDAESRVKAALTSPRGRNFVGAPAA